MPLGKVFAEVALDLNTRQIDQPFTYEIPEALESQIERGTRVRVNFGHRIEEGWVVALSSQHDLPEPPKPILEVVAPAEELGSDRLELAMWLSRRYLCPVGLALRSLTRHSKGARTPGRTWDRALADCLPAGVGEVWPAHPPERLTAGQVQAINAILPSLGRRSFQVYLLFGVTGSGKTEVYLRAMEKAIGVGRDCLLMVPEIILTPQVIDSVYSRLGSRTILWHSGLTAKQRREAWQRVRDGSPCAVVGTRSAVFLPFRDLGLIAVDEEQEVAFKQESDPKYHVRDVAFRLGRQRGSTVILGSATPSVESFYWAERGYYRMVEMGERVKSNLPSVDIVDMRQEIRQGQAGLFSHKLLQELEACLHRGSQAILFLNKRGYYRSLVCQSCGYTLFCPRCSVPLTYHGATKTMNCHYCGYQAELAPHCPQCGSKPFLGRGAGTQRVEAELGRQFPGIRVLRLDTDAATSRKYRELLQQFSRGQADVLVGTQMVAKGLHLPNVSLVGIISADTLLTMPDFRSAERSFQLLTQVAGRAGRGDNLGKVVIQTFNPRHRAIQAAASQDYRRFYQEEIKFRKQGGYPPYSKLLRVLVTGKDEEQAKNLAVWLANKVRQRSEGAAKQIEVLGPAPAPIFRIRNRYRWQMLIKGSKVEDLVEAGQFLSRVAPPTKSGQRISLEVEPAGIML